MTCSVSPSSCPAASSSPHTQSASLLTPAPFTRWVRRNNQGRLSTDYDPVAETWSAKPLMNLGRWYPSALTLPDGSVLSISGFYYLSTNEKGQDITPINNVPQIWSNNTWVDMSPPLDLVLETYPRLHLHPKGRVFMAGTQAQPHFLNVNADGGKGKWIKGGPDRSAGARDAAPSVMYDSGKIMYIGGGNPPTEVTEFIDLNDTEPQWKNSKTTNMKFAGRWHNATVLPDGTVLVTGGTKGAGFNDLTTGQPVHQAELWNPFTKQWTEMDKESADRCYHAIALLLPDGQVLSAGGGEYSPNNDGNPNPAKDSLKNAQLFKPPYLFKGDRPTILCMHSEKISYGQKFEVSVGPNDSILKVSLVRLGSVTHPCNMNQLLIFPHSEVPSLKVTVTAPAKANLAPPGHYMLFVLNQQGVPSVASIIRIPPESKSAKPKPAAVLAQRAAVAKHVDVSLPAFKEKIFTEQGRPAVVVGLTSICPYGLGACWGGSFNALQRISDIEVVRPVPHQADSVAYMYLQEDILPDIDVWRSEFEKIANSSYVMRGIEMALSGVVTKKQLGADEQLTLAGTSNRPDLALAPFQATSKIEWDITAHAPRPMSDADAGAYARLSAALADHPAGLTVQVTGWLQKHGAGKFSLDVREFKVVDADAAAAS